MYLRALTIKNFRSIENIELGQLGALNILIGRNNAGKSSVMSAFEGLAKILTRQAPNWNNIFWGGDQTLALELQLKFEPSPEERDEFISLMTVDRPEVVHRTRNSPFGRQFIFVFRSLPGNTGNMLLKETTVTAEDRAQLIIQSYTLPEIQTAQEVISYYAKRIAQDLKLPSQFAALAPKVTEFLRERAFGQRVDLEDKSIIKAISSNVAQYVTVKTFVGALQPLVVEELTPQLLNPGRRLSECQPFPWSRPTLDHVTKCVFNLLPCDNEFERKFARFLQDARDVERCSKLPESFGFAVEYTDALGNLRYYYPDFVAVLRTGEHYLLETKGQETTEVAYKDRAALNWAENASLLTAVPWRYLKVPQSNFNELQPSEFADLLVFAERSAFN